MALQIGLLQRVIPITTELLGNGPVRGQVDFAFSGETPLGPMLTDGGPDFWIHPGLFDRAQKLRSFCTYQISLEDDVVVMRQDARSTVQDSRVFRASPLSVETTPVDNLLLLMDALRHQEGRCASGDGCQGAMDLRGTLNPRAAVLAERQRYSDNLVAICGACYDEAVKADAGLFDRTVMDGRRLLPHAALQILAKP